MNLTEFLPAIAIGISGLSLILSVSGLARDRGRIKACCQLTYNYTKSEDGKPELHILASNAGRRPITLNYLVEAGENGDRSSPIVPPEPIVGEKGFVIGVPPMFAHRIGVRLEEGQCHEIIFETDEFGLFYDGDRDFAKELYFEDSLGRRYKVKQSKRILAKYLTEAMKRIK